MSILSRESWCIENMNIIIVILIILLIMLSIASIIDVIIVVKTKSYLNYREQLRQFEAKRNRVEEDLENDRKKF